MSKLHEHLELLIQQFNTSFKEKKKHSWNTINCYYLIVYVFYISHNHHDQEHFSRDEHTLFFSYGMEKEQERLEIVKSRKKACLGLK